MKERRILITPKKTGIEATGEDLINAIAQLEHVLFKEVPEDAHEDIKQAIFAKRLMLDINEMSEHEEIIALLKKMVSVL